MGKLIHEELSYGIRGCIFRVYNSLGPGFREETYKQATIRELCDSGFHIQIEKNIPIQYKHYGVIDTYRIDLLVEDKIILELKGVSEIHKRFIAQTLSELCASKLELALLVNFGSDPLEIQRWLNPHLDPNGVETVSSTEQPSFDDSSGSKIIMGELCYIIYGCFYEVYNTLGSGFRLTTYQEALFAELKNAGVQYETNREIPILYKGVQIDTHCIELLVEDKIPISVQAHAESDQTWKSIMKSELKAGHLKLGLIVNFGTRPMDIWRVLNPKVDSES